MSFYITLISDQAQGTGQKFTARLLHLHYLVEDDWEAALVRISYPGFNQQLEDQTKQNWTQEDSAKHWMKTDIKYMPKRADGTHHLKSPKSLITSWSTWDLARLAPEQANYLDWFLKGVGFL